MKDIVAIEGFFGKYRWLSNFAYCPVKLYTATYPSVENAYQAAKTSSLEERKFLETCSAVDAKHYGKQLTLRPCFDEIKLEVMFFFLIQKFNQEPFRTKLLATGDARLVETNTWRDVYWGVCHGRGENHLGRLLMHLRSDLRKTQVLK